MYVYIYIFWFTLTILVWWLCIAIIVIIWNYMLFMIVELMMKTFTLIGSTGSSLVDNGIFPATHNKNRHLSIQKTSSHFAYVHNPLPHLGLVLSCKWQSHIQILKLYRKRWYFWCVYLLRAWGPSLSADNLVIQTGGWMSLRKALMTRISEPHGKTSGEAPNSPMKWTKVTRNPSGHSKKIITSDWK